MRRTISLLVFLAILAFGATSVQALSSYVTTFKTTYPAAASSPLAHCVLCHINPNGGGTRNAYGNAFLAAAHSYAAIQTADSDGDGYSNLTEIQALTFPGDATSHPTAADTAPPLISVFTIPATSSSLTVTISSLTVNDNVGVTGYIINELATAPAAGAAGWSSTVPTSYTAASAGSHTLYVWAKDAAGNVSTSMSASVVIALPVLTDFSATATSGLAPLTVTFSDLSSSTPTSWSWSFGDGASSTLQNPSHTYTTIGNYTVALTATGTGGPVTMTKTAYISVIPCSSMPVKIGGTLSYYPTIESAYAAAITGNVVQMMGQVFSGPLSLLGNATVELQGGFSCDFFTNPGYTTVTGSITIGGGTTVIVENIVII